MIKKLIHSCLISLMILTSCSNPEDYRNVYNSETDFQYPYYTFGGGAIRIASTESGYYFLNGNYIYYADRTTMKPVLLDNNPNSVCLKSSQEEEEKYCNAYVNRGANPAFLAYYKDKIYTLSNRYELGKDRIYERSDLLEISKDGSRRKVKFTFDFPPVAITIHRGMVFFVSRDFSKKSDLGYELKSINLSENHPKPKVIYSGKLGDGDIQNIIAYGDHLYFDELGRDTAGEFMIRTYRYDLQNKVASPLFTNDSDGAIDQVIGIYNSKLIFFKFYRDIEDPRSKVIYVSDYDGTHVTQLPIERDFFPRFVVSGNDLLGYPDATYLNVDPYKEKYKHIKAEITVYNSDYEATHTMEYPSLPFGHRLIGGDEQFMFAISMGNDKEIIYYMDKQQIGTDNAGFIPLIETVLGTDHSVMELP